MKQVFTIIKPVSHALGVSFNDEKQAVCLLMSVDSVSEGGHIAIVAEYYVLEGQSLRLSGASGSLILHPISQMAQDAAVARLPLVVLDPQNEQEILIEPVQDVADIYKEPRP